MAVDVAAVAVVVVQVVAEVAEVVVVHKDNLRSQFFHYSYYVVICEFI